MLTKKLLRNNGNLPPLLLEANNLLVKVLKQRHLVLYPNIFVSFIVSFYTGDHSPPELSHCP